MGARLALGLRGEHPGLDLVQVTRALGLEPAARKKAAGAEGASSPLSSDLLSGAGSSRALFPSDVTITSA